MIIISAMSENRVIGAGDGMPWDVPEEYQQYLDFVKGNTVILGRKSYEIFGKDLTHSNTVVVSRSVPKFRDAESADSLDAAIELAKSYDKTIFVAGGSSIYEQAIPLADEMYLSTIKGRFEGDAYFPEYEESNWRLTDFRESPSFIFRKFVRREKRL